MDRRTLVEDGLQPEIEDYDRTQDAEKRLEREGGVRLHEEKEAERREGKQREQQREQEQRKERARRAWGRRAAE